MQYFALPVRTLASITIGMLASACSLSGLTPQEDGGGNADSGAGDSDTDGSDSGVYTIRGAALTSEAAPPIPYGLQRQLPSSAQECPFLYEPNPCMDPACLEPTSAECQAAVAAYCESHPDDPTCPDGGDTDGGDTDGGSTDGGDADGGDQCPYEHEPSPCTDPACQTDPHSPECQAVHDTYCSMYPAESVCAGGGDGGGDGGEPCPYQYSPNPCDDPACHADPNSEDCEDAHHEYCSMHPEESVCTDDGCPYKYEPNPCTDGACEDDPNTQECQDAHQAYCEEHPDDEVCDHGGDDRGEVVSVHTPSAIWMKVYRVSFSADAEGCTDPFLVAEHTDPDYQNLMDSPVLFQGEHPPEGTYPCVIITMSDHIRWEVEGVPGYEGVQVQELGRDREPPDGVEQEFTFYLSTAGDHESGGIVPPGLQLDEPHEAGPNVLESTFYLHAADVLEVYEDGTCDMQPPRFGFSTTYAE